jgi:hypothetical protein
LSCGVQISDVQRFACFWSSPHAIRQQPTAYTSNAYNHGLNASSGNYSAMCQLHNAAWLCTNKNSFTVDLVIHAYVHQPALHGMLSQWFMSTATATRNGSTTEFCTLLLLQSLRVS